MKIKESLFRVIPLAFAAVGGLMTAYNHPLLEIVSFIIAILVLNYIIEVEKGRG